MTKKQEKIIIEIIHYVFDHSELFNSKFYNMIVDLAKIVYKCKYFMYKAEL